MLKTRSLPRAAVATLTAIALALTVLVVPSTAQAQSNLVINQGSMITTPKGRCTVGLVRAHNHSALTAAHCGNSGDPVSLVVNGKVYPNVGTFYPSTEFSRENYANDWGYVKLNSRVKIGSNKFTGDRAARPTALSFGDRICFHGNSTHPDGNGYAGRIGNNVYFGNDRLGIPGDSGGPVWVDRNGRRTFVGVHSGSEGFSDLGKQRMLGRASYPENGPQITWQQARALFEKFFKIRVKGTWQPTAPDPAQASSDSSSGGGLGSDAIAGIISAVIMLLALVGVNAAKFLR